MRAGAALVEITPRLGTHLAVAMDRPAQAVLDPLFAKAVVFEQDGRKICLLALDILIIGQEGTDQIRTEAARRYGFEAQAIMVHAIQTHAAPCVGQFMVDPELPAVPADRAFVLGGHEVFYCKVAPGSLETVVAEAGGLLRELFGCGFQPASTCQS